jgi:ribosomal protein S18 acetylase RimI-like enzyme
MSSSPTSPNSPNSSRLSTISIRRATIPDALVMAEMQVIMAAETEARELDINLVKRGFDLALNPKSYVQCYLAESPASLIFPNRQEDQQIEEKKLVPVGMIMIRPEFSLLRNSSVFSLEDVYTIPECRGKGVFRKFYDFIRSELIAQKPAESGFCGMRLFVDYKNEGAIGAYARCGMYLEKGRPFRWCKVGGEAPRQDPSEEEIKRLAISPLSARPNEEADAFAKECIHRVDPKEIQQVQLEELKNMIWENAKKYHRFANEKQDLFEEKFKKETLEKSLRRVIFESSTSVITKSKVDDTAGVVDIPAEFYVIKTKENNKIVGCFLLTFEFCTWRRGFIIWMQHFSVADHNDRSKFFRSALRFVQAKVEKNDCQDIPFSGARLELDPEIENETLVKIADEEAFEFEDDMLMRVEL